MARLLCLDVDGTLVDSTGALFDGVSMLAGLRDLGFVVGVSSARPPWALAEVGRSLGGLDFVVSFQGAHAVCWAQGRAEPSTGFSAQLDRDAVELVRDRVAARCALWTYSLDLWDVDRTSATVYREASIVRRLPDTEGRFPDVGIYKIILTDLGKDDWSLAEEVVEGLPVQVHRSNSIYAEIVSSNALPDKGVSWAAAGVGVPLDQAVAVGDAMNDLSMLGAAGFGVTFSDAPSALQDVASMVLDPPGSGGIVRLVTLLESLYLP